MEMDQMIDAQHELHVRILRSVDNLKKIGAAKLNAHTIQAAIRVLDDKWTKFTEQHEELRANYWKEIKEDDYTTDDLLSKVETAYYEQRSQLAELEERFSKPAEAALAERARETAPSRRTLPRINLPLFRIGQPTGTYSAP
ncbi:Bel12-ag transposon polyprotein [Camponotus japonicus]